MSRYKVVLVLCALLTLTGVASAQESPRWGYVEAGYLDFDPDEGSSDSGWYGLGSMKLFKYFHLVAEYDDVGDYTFWNAGFGWHGLLGDPGDLYATARWNDVEVDTDSGDISDDGYDVSAGVRWKFTKWLEARGGATWLNLDEGGSDTMFEAEGIVSILNDRLGFGANYEFGDDDTLKIFARFNFGK